RLYPARGRSRAQPFYSERGGEDRLRVRRAPGAGRKTQAAMSEFARPFTRPPHSLVFEPAVRAALEEDLGLAGDITTDLLIDTGQQSKARIVARAPGTVAGLICAITAFRLVDADVEVACGALDGEAVEADTAIATICGRTRALLTGERVALNFLGHLSGIATTT